MVSHWIKNAGNDVSFACKFSTWQLKYVGVFGDNLRNIFKYFVVELANCN